MASLIKRYSCIALDDAYWQGGTLMTYCKAVLAAVPANANQIFGIYHIARPAPVCPRH